MVELVEIKNTCPFHMQTARNSQGSVTGRYIISDRGPRDHVRPLQLLDSRLQSLLVLLPPEL